jgi:hypothetical protein
MIEKVSADTRSGGHETPLSFSLASVAVRLRRRTLDIDAYERAGSGVSEDAR